MTTEIHLHDNSCVNATYVPNCFIDEYMTAAPGDYVKVYLYLLRCLSGSHPFSIRKIADIFEYTEGDVKRALKYWEKVNMLNLEFDESGNLSGIFFHYGSANDDTKKVAKTAAKPKQAAFSEVIIPPAEDYSTATLNEFASTDIGEQLIYLAELYTAKTLRPEDISTIYYWKNALSFSADLIEYLIENCVSHNINSIRQMDKTAILWYKNNITTIKEAKEFSIKDTPYNKLVTKALGIKGRDLNQWERDYIRKWTLDWHFAEPVLNEACRRTIAYTHQPNFEYADSILKNWHDAKVHSMAEIIALDDAHKAKSAEKDKKNTSSSAPTKFSNFAPRKYDYDDLERILLTN